MSHLVESYGCFKGRSAKTRIGKKRRRNGIGEGKKTRLIGLTIFSYNHRSGRNGVIPGKERDVQRGETKGEGRGKGSDTSCVSCGGWKGPFRRWVRVPGQSEDWKWPSKRGVWKGNRRSGRKRIGMVVVEHTPLLLKCPPGTPGAQKNGGKETETR